jgi:hypothetical protein
MKMSEYNVGDKVYLECEVVNKDMSDNTYQLKYMNWHGVKNVKTNHVTDDVLHTPDDDYNKGLNDAWELAKKIILPSHMGGYTTDELKNIFGKNTSISAISDFTPQEALAKVKKYEEHNVIKVGDVVRLIGCCVEGIVTRVDSRNIYRLFKDGSTTKEALEDVKGFAKTGEHFDSIDEFMRSADD